MAIKTPNAPSRPTFMQIAALALDKAEEDIKRLVNIRCADEHWLDADNDVDYAVELALSHIRAMRAATFNDGAEFGLSWLKAGAAINLASRAFSRTGCAHERHLKDAGQMFIQLAELVEFVG